MANRSAPRSLLAGCAALALVATAAGATPPTRGQAIVGGTKVPVRYASAFRRTTGSGGYAILLSDRRVRCSELHKLPDENSLGQRWALVALYPTKDGYTRTGPVLGEMEYPVGDAYASLSRGVSINLASAGLFPGVVWRGKVDQPSRTVGGKRYEVHARFTANWCG
jgi:hypothetical protein